MGEWGDYMDEWENDFDEALIDIWNEDYVPLPEYDFSLIHSKNANYDKLLMEAVKRGHLNVIEDLLQHGSNVNALSENFYIPLHYATKYKHKEAVELLIQYGANINERGLEGETPILIALCVKCLEIVNIFLDLNASLEDQPELLVFAVEAGFKEVIDTLLQRGFDVNARDEEGRTALHHTANSFYNDNSGALNAEIAELLISKGADVNAQDNDDRTPLHYVYQSFPKLVKTLLYYEADVNIKDSYTYSFIMFMDMNSFTPLEIAWNKYFEFFFILNLDNPEDSPNNKVFDILLCHVFKMKMANLFLDEGNLKVVELSGEINEGKQGIDWAKFFEKYNYFENECKQEIARMKSKTFKNSNISLYEILVKDSKILAKYMNNENIVEELKSNDYKSEFPIYARMIEINFIKGMQRKELFDKVRHNYHFIFKPFSGLPHQCANKILDLLCAEDLLNFEDALNLPDDSLM